MVLVQVVVLINVALLAYNSIVLCMAKISHVNTIPAKNNSKAIASTNLLLLQFFPQTIVLNCQSGPLQGSLFGLVVQNDHVLLKLLVGLIERVKGEGQCVVLVYELSLIHISEPTRRS